MKRFLPQTVFHNEEFRIIKESDELRKAGVLLERSLGHHLFGWRKWIVILRQAWYERHIPYTLQRLRKIIQRECHL